MKNIISAIRVIFSINGENKMKKILILFLSVILLTGCSDWTIFGPYHHEALINTQEVVEFNGRKFSHFVELYEFKNDTYEKLNIDFDGKNIRHIESHNEKLYISTFYSIFILNKELIIEEKLDIPTFSYFVDDNYIYYTSNTNEYDFYVYDFENKESTLMASNLRNSTYSFNEKLIYVNDYGNIFDVTNGNKFTSYFLQSFYNGHIRQGDYNPSFYANNNTGIIYWKDDKLTVTYGNEIYEVESNGVNIIYGSIHIENNKVIFASYEYQEHDDCNNLLNCICHFGTNCIWSFDLETKTITKLHTFEDGTYLISFDENNYCYYKDGKVYRNKQEIMTVNKVEPYGEFTQVGDDNDFASTQVSVTYFYDDGTNVYHKYFDYKDTLKDQY